MKLTEVELESLYDKMEVRSCKRNTHLLQMGQLCNYTYFVNSGWLRLYDIDEKGYEKNTVFAKEEWWVSDLYSYHRQRPATYFLQALEDSEVLALSKNNMEHLLLEIPKLERFWRILHINALIAQQERVMFMMTKTAEERYRDFIEKYPDAELRISQKHIASYLGITPQFLSKMKGRLKQ